MPRNPSRKKKNAPPENDANKSIGDMLPKTQAMKLCRRAGIKQQQTSVTEHLRQETFPELLKTVVRDAIELMDYGDNKTIQLRHIEKAVQQRYGKKTY